MDKKWYVVNTYSGHENKVKEKLEMRTVSMGMEDYIFRVIVPEEKVIEEKNGVKKEKIKKLFPGYILVEMIMTDEAWFVVRNTPFPLQPYEVDKILNDMGMSRLEVNTDLKEGTLVKVISDPFSGMEGKVDSFDKDNNKLIVLLDLFGQETSVEVEFSQIEKINA